MDRGVGLGAPATDGVDSKLGDRSKRIPWEATSEYDPCDDAWVDTALGGVLLMDGFVVDLGTEAPLFAAPQSSPAHAGMLYIWTSFSKKFSPVLIAQRLWTGSSQTLHSWGTC